MRGDKNRDPLVGCFVDHFPKLAPHGRIDSAGRFIEKNDLRRVENCHRESQLLFPSQRQGFDHGVSLLFEFQPVKQLIGFFIYLMVCHPVNTSKKTNVFPYFQVFVQRKFLTHIADIAFYLLVLSQNIVSGNCPFPRCRFTDAAKHLHGSGLSGTVSTQEPEYLPLADIKGNMIDGSEIAEFFSEVRYFNNFHVHYSFVSAIKQSSTVGATASISTFEYPFSFR
ncbi:hypothetical protein SDC9_82835 [bioreactor metagenome]|uniref:Uncharacterized protein n=1 Tax=bioreactor metagenome TaxID=1076179 RepID=A0A644Z5Z7_9ZZZZ